MITIKATCARDGEVILMPADITLTWCVDAPDSGSWYTFRCPTCGVVNQKVADTYIIELLRRHGLMVTQWAIGAGRTPFRIDEAPVDEDDLIAFGRLLHRVADAVDPYQLPDVEERRAA